MQYREDFGARSQGSYMRESLRSRDGQYRERALSATESIKMAKSNEFFKSTRVDSCPYVVVKNGVAQAIPFRPKPKQIDNTPFYCKSDYQ